MSLLTSVQEALSYLASRERFGIKPGLGRTRELLAALGDPQQRLRCLHVAGTNGKGSTCAILASILTAAGYRVGLYTSPYLTAFANRMSVQGVDIGDADLIRYTEQVRALIESSALLQADPPTEFEITTAIAFLFFAKENVDFVVLETGLGGRYDATNVSLPVVSAITNIGYDHMNILGPRLQDIAYDKAGIIKQGVPVVTGAQDVALRVISRVADDVGSSLRVRGTDFRFVVEEAGTLLGQRVSYYGLYQDFLGLWLPLLGAHQAQNLSVALAAVEELRAQGYAVDALAIRRGVSNVRWAGRLEVMAQSPLVLLDGAHNPAGSAALGASLQQLGISSYVLVTGVLADKDMAGILRHTVPRAAHVLAVRPDTSRAADAEMIASIAQGFAPPGICVESCPSVASSLRRAVEIAELSGNIPVVVTGTLYVVAQAREILMREAVGL